jgi:hypothetical protein
LNKLSLAVGIGWKHDFDNNHRRQLNCFKDFESMEFVKRTNIPLLPSQPEHMVAIKYRENE